MNRFKSTYYFRCTEFCAVLGASLQKMWEDVLPVLRDIMASHHGRSSVSSVPQFFWLATQAEVSSMVEDAARRLGQRQLLLEGILLTVQQGSASPPKQGQGPTMLSIMRISLTLHLKRKEYKKRKTA